MPRHWLIPLLVVALVAGVALYVTADGKDGGSIEEPDTPDRDGPPRAILTDGEVRAYISIWPRLKDLGSDIASDVARAAAEGKPFDREAAGARLRAKRNAILKSAHLTPADWDKLRQRVEFVIAATRWEEERPAREKELTQTIADKEALLPAAEETNRKQIQFEIDRLRAQIGAPGPAVAESDLALVRSYWAQLDPIALRSPAAMPSGGVSTGG